ncbi:MAG: hypothetical protein WD403_09350, partial [Pirellulales bacterium]
MDPTHYQHEPQNSSCCQFTLRALILFSLALPVFVGAASALDFASFEATSALAGNDWSGNSRRLLINYGLSPTFVASYASIALLYLPGWTACAVINLAFGSIRSPWLHRAAWLLAISLPLSNAAQSPSNVAFLLSWNVRLVSL